MKPTELMGVREHMRNLNRVPFSKEHFLLCHEFKLTRLSLVELRRLQKAERFQPLINKMRIHSLSAKAMQNQKEYQMKYFHRTNSIGVQYIHNYEEWKLLGKGIQESPYQGWFPGL